MARLRKYWAANFALLVIFLTIMSFVWRLKTFELIDALFYSSHDGRPFFYWSLYLSDIFFLIAPVGCILLLGIARLSHSSILTLAKQSRPTKAALIVLSGIALFSCVLFLFNLTTRAEVPLPQHLTSVQLEDNIYHLGGLYFIAGENRYIFYSCDRFGLFCRAAYTEESSRYRQKSFNDLRLVISPLRTTSISMEIDGQIVFTYSPDKQE